jgi:uncharacterized protein YqjF (DUF2071 family)
MKFIAAEWRKLIMANYEIDPSVLKKYLPAGTELDTWQDKHYTSLVGFMFINTKVLGLKIPFHINFPEVNLRFYVKRKVQDEWKRGVVFINEFVPRPAITFVANTLFKERYVTYPIKHSWEMGEKLNIGYYWKKDKSWNKLEVITTGDQVDINPGSKEEFITEHYWGYSGINKNETGEYEVQHPRWEVYPVENYSIECDFAALYGNDFAALDQTMPSSVLLAEGSSVSIYSKKIFSV